MNYAETQTLLQRMGDLRQHEAGNQGGNDVWAHVYGGKFDSIRSGFSLGMDMNYTGVMAGIDRRFALKDNKGDFYVGAMFGYTKGEPNYWNGSGDVENKSIGLYGTYMSPSGFYVDTILKYGWMNSDYKVLDTQGMLVKADDMDSDGFHGSIEVGKRFHFNKQEKKGWYLEPQVQLSYGHESGGKSTASSGLVVDVSSYDSLLGRVGTLIGYEIKGGKNPINIYGKVSWVHEFDGDGSVLMNGAQRQDLSFGGDWITYGIGVTAQISKKHNLYLDVERASGDTFDQSWSINGGYRFSW